jgi:hypothetical protein
LGLTIDWASLSGRGAMVSMIPLFLFTFDSGFDDDSNFITTVYIAYALMKVPVTRLEF